MLAKGHDWVEVTRQAQHAFNVKLQQRLQRTVWMSGCKSWYLTTIIKDNSSTTAGSPGNTAAAASNVLDSSPAGSSQDWGAGSNGNASGGGVVMWPGLCTEFWWRTLWPVAQDWQSGKAAHPVGEKPGAVARKDTAMQEEEVLGKKGL